MIPKRRSKNGRMGTRKDDSAYWDRRQGQFVRGFNCLINNSECVGRIESHHEKSRGAGGKAEDQVPLCLGHHDERHHGKETFARKYNIDLTAKAEWFANHRQSPLRERDRQLQGVTSDT